MRKIKEITLTLAVIVMLAGCSQAQSGETTGLGTGGGYPSAETGQDGGDMGADLGGGEGMNTGQGDGSGEDANAQEQGDGSSDGFGDGSGDGMGDGSGGSPDGFGDGSDYGDGGFGGSPSGPSNDRGDGDSGSDPDNDFDIPDPSGSTPSNPHHNTDFGNGSSPSDDGEAPDTGRGSRNYGGGDSGNGGDDADNGDSLPEDDNNDDQTPGDQPNPSPTPGDQTRPDKNQPGPGTDPSKNPEGTPAPPNNLLIVIDPGHQQHANTEQEPIGPGAAETKAKVTGGTTGVKTGLHEYELTLTVSQKLQSTLENRGYTVIMTRTSHDVNLSNSERAAIANNNHADAFIRIHANGSEDPSVNGAMTICQTTGNPYNAALHDQSFQLSTTVLDGLVASTGCKKQRVWETDTMSGINWCQVPVTIVEMGYMSNPAEDTLMATDDYQWLMANGIADGIDTYFGLNQK